MFQALHCDLIGEYILFFRAISDSENQLLEVETDSHGIKSNSLRSILQNWPSTKQRPKVLYTVPVRTLT